MKIILRIYISLCLILSPIFVINSANAATVGGWSISGLVADGASSIVNGTKQVIIDGKNYIKKGTAKITPTASQVSKVLARGAAGYALSVAVEQLLGAVDWVLDPENNQIRYLNPNSPELPLPNIQYKSNANILYDTMNALCSDWVPSSPFGWDYNWSGLARTVNNEAQPVEPAIGYRVQCGLKHKINGDLTDTAGGFAVARTEPMPEEENEEKTLPLDVVAQQVISNAESGDTNAQVATTAAAQDIINEAEQDEAKARPIVQQLEASASTENADSAAQDAANEATGQSQPNTANPQATDIKLNFPVFCGWAPVVCQAAQVAISFPAKAQIWVNDLLGQGEKIEEEQKRTTAEAAKTAQATQAIQQELTNEKDLPAKDTSTVLLPDVPITPQTVNVNWGNSCPAPTTVNLSFGGQTKQVTILNYQFICEWAWVVEYSVIALASISSVFIVAGRKS